MAYQIEISDLAEVELRGLRVFERRKLVDALRAQLTFEPNVETRNRKQLMAVVPDFEHTPPIWELRIGEYRAFYDVDEPSKVVFVRAIRRKEHGQTTQDIIHDRNDT